MKKIKILISAVLAAIILSGLLCQLSYNTVALPVDEPLVYYNDVTWAREDRSPLKYIDNTYYLPLTLFAQLKDTKVRVNNSLNTFVITHSELYISIDATTNIATDQSDNMFMMKTYKLDYGERYVPASMVCMYLGLGFDSFTSELTGETAVRITDGTEELQFKELLETYNPDILKVAEATEKQESTKADTDITDIFEKLPGRRTVYLTFPSDINEHTETILDTLLNYGYTATFFVDTADIQNHPLTVTRILSEGHKLGLKPRDPAAYTDIDSILSELDKANQLLYRVYKTKTRTAMLDSIYTANNELAQAVDSGELKKYGYSVWKTSTERTDGYYYNNIAIDKNIDAIVNNFNVVFDFGSNVSTQYVLGATLNFILANAESCDVRLADSAFTPPF